MPDAQRTKFIEKDKGKSNVEKLPILNLVNLT